jgi:cell division protein FtsX
VIISFVIFFLRTIFNTFWHDIQVKKLLWASKSQIIMPFMWIIGYAIIGGFVVSLLLTLVSLWTFDYYMTKLFSTTLTSTLFANWWMILLMFVLEIIIILGLIIGVSYIFVSRLHKKLK